MSCDRPRYWYIEARVGSHNYRGECVRFINDRRSDPTRKPNESSYENEEATVVVQRLMDENARLRALLDAAPAREDVEPCACGAYSFVESFKEFDGVTHRHFTYCSPAPALAEPAASQCKK